MDHYNDFSSHNKHPDVLVIYPSYVISPVVRSQGYMVKTPKAGIIRKNQSMMVETDQGASIQPNGILTHSNPTSF